MHDPTASGRVQMEEPENICRNSTVSQPVDIVRVAQLVLLSHCMSASQRVFNGENPCLPVDRGDHRDKWFRTKSS